jgi:hypothetical protein
VDSPVGFRAAMLLIYRDDGKVVKCDVRVACLCCGGGGSQERSLPTYIRTELEAFARHSGPGYALLCYNKLDRYLTTLAILDIWEGFAFHLQISFLIHLACASCTEVFSAKDKQKARLLHLPLPSLHSVTREGFPIFELGIVEA